MVNDDTPKGSLARGLVGGKTAARMGGAYLKYAVGKPFLSEDGRENRRRQMSEQSMETLFQGLCRLRGIALKMAQTLSLEVDIFPEHIRTHLERAYNGVPPMNRALTRKVLTTAYGKAPEKVFRSFEGTAFAAASLGQVHRAVGANGESLALKIQYPGIRDTIRGDMRLVKTLLRPFIEYKAIKPMFAEIETRFLEETDYLLEAENTAFFHARLQMRDIRVPVVYRDVCTGQVLCLSLLEGKPLNAWLGTNPDTRARDTVAQRLQDLFIHSLYGLRCIHADPHPGNFLVLDDNSTGLVDFGCVKRLDTPFVELYRQLLLALTSNDNDACMSVLRQLGTIPDGADAALERDVRETFIRYGKWLRSIFSVEKFDFGEKKNFVREGKDISMTMKHVLRKLRINPDFVFLDRTRYGLLRLFEKMEACVSFRNEHECS
jgi:predicted unusual protein kinase regulating ubiquinone biosynthesis (AarF/ABC1/UbiB family)